MDSNHRFLVAIGQVRTPEWRSLRRKYPHSLGLGVLFNAGLPRGTGSSNPPPSSAESGINRIAAAARLARDRAFDGAFFTGVRTTRIYCRPVCPVRPARSANIVFFGSAAAEERAGFRPCLRCRPETAPGL